MAAKQPYKLVKGRLYEIIWHDAYSTSSWHSLENVVNETPCKCATVGWYVGRNKAGDICVAGTHDHHDSFGSVMARPVGMIQQIRELKSGKKIPK